MRYQGRLHLTYDYTSCGPSLLLSGVMLTVGARDPEPAI
jgi:hypothetical protein